jgi:hypothetical protein
MFNLDSMSIQSEYQRQEFQREANHRRLVHAAKGAAAGTPRRRLSINLNLFSSRPKEEERYAGVARRQALNSR